MKRKLLLITLSLLILSSLKAGVGVGSDVFSKGRVHGSVNASIGRAFDQDYTIIGGGIGAMLFDGLEIGFDGSAWIGQHPNIYSISPNIRYVFPIENAFQPYMGAFFKQTFYEGPIKDLGSYGGRAGIYSKVGEHTYGGIGIVYEKYLNCDETIYNTCSRTYPEANLSFWF